MLACQIGQSENSWQELKQFAFWFFNFSMSWILFIVVLYLFCYRSV